MIELEAFLQEQQQVYDKFRAAYDTIRAEGTTLPKTVEGRDGYLVILKHSDEIVERCADFSHRIAQVVPAMLYEGITVHTTLGVVGMQYRPPWEQSIDGAAVARLEDAIYAVAKEFPPVTIPYQGWLYNRDTTIAQGIAGEAFVRLADMVHESLKRYSVAAEIGKVQQPWGGHITVSRFMEKTPPNQLGSFFDVVESEPALPLSRPEAVCLGYVSVKAGLVKIEIRERFPLKL